MKMDLMSKSSHHGKTHRKKQHKLEYLCRDKNVWMRSLYITGFIGFFSGCLYQSWSFLNIYFKYPTTMEVSVEQAPLLLFPAVTLCNGNRVRQDLWCSLDQDICHQRPNETTENYITRMQDTYKYLNRSIRIFMGHTREKFIKSCQFEDRTCDGLIGQYFNYEYTNCFTINARWENRSGKPFSASMFRPRNGRSSELSIMLDLEKDKYSPMNPVVRARMTIHAADTIPNPQYDGVSLQPGFTYNYGIRENIVHVLPYPYQTNCKNYSQLKEIRTRSKQTQEGCMSECCVRLHVKYCNCTVHRLSLIYDIRTCWKTEEEQCLKNHDQIAKDLCYPECRMPCTKITYAYISVDSFTLQQGACYDVDMFNRTLSKKDKVYRYSASLVVTLDYG
ncbi:Acid-sensing ion channel 1 like protein [Argiope bruennichi]|uniref:Acid-sensing ion channel 1 like protein n=1 Tax=Argiope bruennichi TaxID=94029 RepID=A0A8T0EMQ6_ARGBR|nr:Acid-sensing ion channel 1 like protein [Argiope bruennichi]